MKHTYRVECWREPATRGPAAPAALRARFLGVCLVEAEAPDEAALIAAQRKPAATVCIVEPVVTDPAEAEALGAIRYYERHHRWPENLSTGAWDRLSVWGHQPGETYLRFCGVGASDEHDRDG